MDIYAELSKKICKDVNENGFYLLPSGVSLSRKRESRYCFFTCDNERIAKDLIDALDAKGIPWQEN